MATNWRWDDARCFLAAVREGTLSGAARALGIDHVTVGRRITALERQLGAKLLQRTPEGFEATAAGQTILRECEAMENAALVVERLAAGYDTRARGIVRVTTTEVLASAVIVPCLTRLRRTHPDIQIDLMTSVRSLDISRREADLAVRLARPTHLNLVCHKLGELSFAVYASRPYLAERGAPERGHRFGGHDVITYAATPPSISPSFMGESLEGARLSLRCNNPLLQMKAAEDGLGIAELACIIGDKSPQLARLWPNTPPIRRPIWMVIHSDLRRAARIRIVSVAITQAFEGAARSLRGGIPSRVRIGR